MSKNSVIPQMDKEIAKELSKNDKQLEKIKNELNELRQKLDNISNSFQIILNTHKQNELLHQSLQTPETKEQLEVSLKNKKLAGTKLSEFHKKIAELEPQIEELEQKNHVLKSKS